MNMKSLIRRISFLLALGAFPLHAADSPPFKHPGLLNDAAELAFLKQKIAAGQEPWKSALAQTQSSYYASSRLKPKAREVVEYGPYGQPDNGGSDEARDATAAYTQALLWALTGQEDYARNSAAILNAWAATLQSHTGGNAKLQAAFAGFLFPQAAEILRSTWPQWAKEQTVAVTAMFNRAFIPLLGESMPSYNGNWELCIASALIAIGVFDDDKTTFDRGVFLWQTRIPAYFYLTSDGALPVRPNGVNFDDSQLLKYWRYPQFFVDGLCQETERDLGHVQLGLGGAVNGAEVAWRQGVDLYSKDAERIAKAMEFHANYLLGNPVPQWLFGGKLSTGKTPILSTWEIAYNHLHNRMGMDLPLTRKLIEQKVRPSGANIPLVWESLTHAELGNAGETIVQAPK